MFSAAIRGYRILFANLWSHDRYSGRICVEPLGFAWDLFGEHRQTGSAEEK